MTASPKAVLFEQELENIIDFLNHNYGTFAKGQKRIASFILSNIDRAPFLNADELAKHVNVSPSSVVRFSKKIGFSGYPEMQKSLQKLLIDKINTSGPYDRAKKFRQLIQDNEIFNSFSKDLSNLNKLIDSINYDDLKAFVDIIVGSKNKFVVANLSSYSLGHFFSFHSGKIIAGIQFLCDYDGGIFNYLKGLSSEDVVIAFCFPRYSTLTLKYSEYAAKKEAKIVSITDSKASPIYRMSKVCLFCPNDGYFLQNSNVAPMALLNCIIAEIFCRNKEQATKNLKEIEAISTKLNLIEKIY